MWKAMVAGLLSMTAMTPPALAQERSMDRGEWRRDRAERISPREAMAPRPERPGGEVGARPAPPPPEGGWQARPDVPRGPEARPERDGQDRRGDGQRRGGERRWDRGPGTVAPPPPQGGAWRDRPDGQRRWDDQRRPDGVRRPPPPGGDWRSERADPRARFGFSRPGSPGIWRSERDQRWDRDWRREPRYDWRGYRAERHSLFRLPRYYAPYGWDGGYRRFGLGVPLAPMLYTPRYWIYDPWAYRLPEADEPYRWVRYYNDALLVDIEDGTVVDVIHGIFE